MRVLSMLLVTSPLRIFSRCSNYAYVRYRSNGDFTEHGVADYITKRSGGIVFTTQPRLLPSFGPGLIKAALVARVVSSSIDRSSPEGTPSVIRGSQAPTREIGRRSAKSACRR
ncbi:hypothetical protein BDP67DRAFT_524612 [Colletotrichum lupini]|nr:hypothetical protein BDP67DRAFT_524612 [Colletotrichum lupini]